MDKFARKSPRLPHPIVGAGSLTGELEHVEGLRPAKRRDVAVADGPRSEKVRIAQNFAVSSLSASLAHVPHHPLYTLKTQMMFRGRNFRLRKFLTVAWESRGTFLMRGMYVFVVIALKNVKN